jgi:hypothetical protein
MLIWSALDCLYVFTIALTDLLNPKNLPVPICLVFEPEIIFMNRKGGEG